MLIITCSYPSLPHLFLLTLFVYLWSYVPILRHHVMSSPMLRLYPDSCVIKSSSAHFILHLRLGPSTILQLKPEIVDLLAGLDLNQLDKISTLLSPWRRLRTHYLLLPLLWPILNHRDYEMLWVEVEAADQTAREQLTCSGRRSSPPSYSSRFSGRSPPWTHLGLSACHLCHLSFLDPSGEDWDTAHQSATASANQSSDTRSTGIKASWFPEPELP